MPGSGGCWVGGPGRDGPPVTRTRRMRPKPMGKATPRVVWDVLSVTHHRIVHTHGRNGDWGGQRGATDTEIPKCRFGDATAHGAAPQGTAEG